MTIEQIKAEIAAIEKRAIETNEGWVVGAELKRLNKLQAKLRQ